MFRLKLHEIFIVYTALCIAVIFAAAWLHNIFRTMREKRSLRGVLKCRMCAFTFREESGTVLPRCPNCSALTERKPLSGL